MMIKKLFFALVILTTLEACSQGKNPKSDAKPIFVEARLRVEGMHCNNCENSIAKGVNQLAGIDSIKANHLDSTAFVRFDTNKTNLAEISKAIEERGFHVAAAK